MKIITEIGEEIEIHEDDNSQSLIIKIKKLKDYQSFKIICFNDPYGLAALFKTLYEYFQDRVEKGEK
jgi:hypothetical protein